MKHLSEDEIIDFVVNSLAKNINHKHYDKTVAVADHWRKVVCGEDQDAFILKKKQNNNELQKSEAVKIFNTPTPYVANRIKTPFKEVHRTKRVNKVLELRDEDKKEENPLFISYTKQLEDIYKGLSLDEFLKERLLDYCFTDPNAYLLIDFFPFDKKNEPPTVYPLIFESKDVIHKQDDYKGLQLITFRKPTHVTVSDEIKLINAIDPKGEQKKIPEEKAYKYFTYTRNYSYEIIDSEIYGKVDFEFQEGNTVERVVEVTGGRTKKYYINSFVHSSNTIPVNPLGYIKDVTTNYETFESVLIPAKHTIQELVENKSKSDNHKAVHGFARMYAYVQGCDYKDEEGSTCENGYVNNSECPSCGGSAIKPLKSRTTKNEFEILEVEIPLQGVSSNEDLLDISKLSNYQEIPKVIIDMINQDVKELEQKTSLAIFNTSIFDNNKLASQTQLEIQHISKPVNNVIYEYAQHYEKIWKFVVDQTASYYDIEEQVNRNISFDSDFKLESEIETIAIIKQGKDAGVGQLYIKLLERDLIQKKYQDQPQEVVWFDTKNKFRPFYNKSENEKLSELGFLDKRHPKRILYQFFDEIFNDIRHSGKLEGVKEKYSKPFIDLEYFQQKDVLSFFINQYAETISEIEIPISEGEFDV